MPFTTGEARSRRATLTASHRPEAIRKPDYAEPSTTAAHARYGHKGDLEGASRIMNEAIRLKPDFAEAIANRERLTQNHV
jgi:hypothetical protein